MSATLLPQEKEQQENVTSLETAAATTVRRLRNFFNTGATKSYEWRVQQLNQLIKLLDEKQDELMDALMKDSGKAEFTAYSGDVLFARSEALFALKNLKKWMKPTKVKTQLMLLPAKSEIRCEPLGVILIIGAWNFPIHLTLGPLVGALSAGNCALIKPSEISPRVSALLAKYVPQYFAKDAVAVLEGGVAETTDILAQRFDKILYTGNSQVAKIVMTAAAKYLTPVTLELGGKNPCFVDKTCNLEVTANRIVDNKFSNAGQICVAPDYILVHEDIYAQFIEIVKNKITEFFGADPRTSNVYSRIINERHLGRLRAMLGSGEIVCGGQIDERDNYLAPTVLKNVAEDSPVMQDEIFGPILPVFSYKNLDDAIAKVNQREKPLALYIFTEDDQMAEHVLANTSSGGVSVNAVMMHVANHRLPFGGVGQSGMDAYHGKFSFENLSHRKSILKKATWLDPRGTYPPFTEKDMAMRKKITKWLTS